MNEIDKYIAEFPKETQKLLNQFRATIIKAAPKAEEVISYKMPAYKYHGMLVYFAAWKNHIGFYPAGSTLEKFKKDLVDYKRSKGSVHFPYDQPLPLELISRIVKYRAKENLEKAESKKKDASSTMK